MISQLNSRGVARLMMAPAVILLLGWMLAPLTTTLYFSFKKYLPLRGGDLGWVVLIIMFVL
jgi:sorbitol/mannitol transport system permease protein